MTGAYSPLDRLLHRMAFASPEIQMAVADMEDRVFGGRFANVSVVKPVFITSLPRAGTTLLLHTLASVPSFAAHTYRDMPFVLCPMFWDAISRPFRKGGFEQERAHGDGMVVSFDTPEAFEETIWKAFWPDHFRRDRITLWTVDSHNEEFEQFYKKHIRKIIALRAGQSAAPRYIAKNNAQIARIPLIYRMFPDAVTIIPFRDPVAQAGSMLYQHHNFTEMHRADPFAKDYMEGIGHFEFGASHRRIDFGSRLADTYDPQSGNYWLAYWIEAFEYLAGLVDMPLTFFDYERACADPPAAVRALTSATAITADDAGCIETGAFRPAKQYDSQLLGLDRALLDRAKACHAALAARAINR